MSSPWLTYLREDAAAHRSLIHQYVKVVEYPDSTSRVAKSLTLPC
jgi:hypothetical protein